MRAIKGFVVIGILSLAPVLASAAPNAIEQTVNQQSFQYQAGG